ATSSADRIEEIEATRACISASPRKRPSGVKIRSVASCHKMGKREPASDIDTGVADKLKMLDPDGRLEKRTHDTEQIGPIGSLRLDDFANGPDARSRPRRGQSRGGYPPAGNGALSPSLRSGSTRRGKVPAACRPESNLDRHC